MAIQQQQVLIDIKRIVKYKKIFYYKAIKRFFQLNYQLLCINNDLKEYARFWSLYLTISLPNIVITLTYEMYFLTNGNNIPLFQKYFFLLAAFQLMLSLYLLILECAQVVKINGKCLVENRKFYLKIPQLKKSYIKPSDLLKVKTVDKKPSV